MLFISCGGRKHSLFVTAGLKLVLALYMYVLIFSPRLPRLFYWQNGTVTSQNTDSDDVTDGGESYLRVEADVTDISTQTSSPLAGVNTSPSPDDLEAQLNFVLNSHVPRNYVTSSSLTSVNSFQPPATRAKRPTSLTDNFHSLTPFTYDAYRPTSSANSRFVQQQQRMV